MNEYIKRSDVIDKLEIAHDLARLDQKIVVSDIMREVKDLPAEDVEPIRPPKLFDTVRRFTGELSMLLDVVDELRKDNKELRERVRRYEESINNNLVQSKENICNLRSVLLQNDELQTTNNTSECTERE